MVKVRLIYILLMKTNSYLGIFKAELFNMEKNFRLRGTFNIEFHFGKISAFQEKKILKYTEPEKNHLRTPI